MAYSIISFLGLSGVVLNGAGFKRCKPLLTVTAWVRRNPPPPLVLHLFCYHNKMFGVWRNVSSAQVG